MKFVFSFILLLHTLIHLMGFAKAFQLVEINQLSQSISKPMGILWLITALMFICSAALFLTKQELWFIVAFIAILNSQALIILLWKDAKFGTIINIIVLLVSISAFGNFRFNKMVQKESAQILQNIQVENTPVISENDILHLPEIIQKWIKNSGVIGKEKVISLRLEQIGQMRTKTDSKWMPFTAIQHFNVVNPSFVWTTKVDAMPVLKMVGRDKMYNGEGEMLIKLASLIPVVNEGKNKKINQGVMIRFLAEICWFPSAALNDYMTWETIDATSAKVTLTADGQKVSGVFSFSDKGDLVSFEAKRYYGSETNSKLEKWHVEVVFFKTFNGIKIPNKSSVIWKLEEGDFKWLDLEIVDLEYNVVF